MNEKEQFWEKMREPQKKGCWNCKFNPSAYGNKTCHYELLTCVGVLSENHYDAHIKLDSRPFVKMYAANWQWDEKTY